MSDPLVYADYHKTDDRGRVVLACHGTFRDIEKHGISLEEGLALTFYMDDADDDGNADELLVDGVLEYDATSSRWVAVIDRETFRHASESRVA